MTAVVDNLIAARIIYLLVTPFNKWEAYKQGIIDEDGNRTDKDVGDSDDWSMLHRLVSRLKKLLGTFPGGKSVIASVAAAYLLVRECVERDIEPELLEDYYHDAVGSDEPMTFETFNFVVGVIDDIYEEGEAPTNVVGGGAIAGAKPDEEPPVNMKKRKKKNASIVEPS